eukprot:PhF_6_TR27902/c1_g1_i1/m.40919
MSSSNPSPKTLAILGSTVVAASLVGTLVARAFFSRGNNSKAVTPNAARRPELWTTAEVCGWAKNVVGLPDVCVNALRDNMVDGEVLLSLTEAQLQEIGITVLGPRTKLLNAIHKFQSGRQSQQQHQQQQHHHHHHHDDAVPQRSPQRNRNQQQQQQQPRTTESSSGSSPSRVSRQPPPPPPASEEVNPRTALLFQQLEKIVNTIRDENFKTLPTEQKRMLLSVSLQMLQKVVGAVELIPEDDRIMLMQRATDIAELIEKTEESLLASVGGGSGSGAPSPYTNALETLLKALTTKPFESAAQLAPFAEAIEKVLQNEAILSNPVDAALLKKCIAALVQQSEKFGANGGGGAPAATQSPQRSRQAQQQQQPEQSVSTEGQEQLTMFSQQLDRVSDLLSSPAFLAQPDDKKRNLISTALQMMEKMATAIQGFPPQLRRVVEDKIRSLYAVCNKHIEGGDDDDEDDGEEGDEDAPAQPPQSASQSQQQLQQLLLLYKTLSEKSFSNMSEIKPFADILQKVIANDEILSNPRCAEVVEKCMQKLTEVSESLRSGSSGGAAPRNPLDTINENITPQTRAVVSQLERVANLLNSPAFPSLEESRRTMVFQTATSLLQGVNDVLDNAPLPDRQILVLKSRELIDALNRVAPSGVEDVTDDNNNNDDNGEEDDEDEEASQKAAASIPTARKVEMLSRLCELINNPAFPMMKIQEQVEMMQRVITVLQMMSNAECAANKEVVQMALRSVDTVQARLKDATSDVLAPSSVVDLLPRICDRVGSSDFLELTSRYQLSGIRFVVSESKGLVESLSGEAREALSEILVPLQTLLDQRMSVPNAITRLGSKHTSGDESLRYGFQSPSGENDKLIWRNVVLFQDGEDVDVLPTDNVAAVSKPELPPRTLETSDMDVALIYTQDRSLDVIAKFLAQILRDQGFRVLDIIGSEQALPDLLTSVVEGASNEPHRILAYSIMFGEEDDDYKIVTNAYKEFATRVPPAVKFLAIHDNIDSFHVLYSTQGSADGCSVLMTPDATQTLQATAFPFEGTFTPLVLEALHHDGYNNGESPSLSVEQLLNFVLSRACPQNPVNTSPRKGSSFTGRGFSHPFFSAF